MYCKHVYLRGRHKERRGERDLEIPGISAASVCLAPGSQTVSARAAWRNITRCHLGNKSSRWDSARTSARQDAAAQPLTVPVLTPAVDTQDQSCSGDIRKRRNTHLLARFLLLLCCSLKVCAAQYFVLASHRGWITQISIWNQPQPSVIKPRS